MIPIRTPSGSVTGRARRSYFDIVSATSSAETSAVALFTGVVITFSSVASSSGGEELAHRKRAEEDLALVDDVEIEEDLGVARDGAEPQERLFDGEVRRERHEVRSHEAARRVLVVNEELGDLVGGLLLHELDEVARVLALDLAEDVGGLVRGHLLEDLRSVLLGQVLEDLGLHLRLQLVQRFGGGLDVQLSENAGALGARDLAQDVGDVRRMEALEPLLRERRLQAVELGWSGWIEFPRDEARGERAVRQASARGGVNPAPKTRAHEPRTPTSAAVSTRSPADDVELEVVDTAPTTLHAVDVDDLLVEQVACEEDLVFARRPVDEVRPS